MYALVDGNSFFCSCERVYRPDLKDRPIVVLSNNDGCVVARNAEAKALGIKMGVPYFQVAYLAKQGKLEVFSSNYELYGDLSRRMMQTIASLSPRIEIYSIDECFADFTGLDRFAFRAAEIRARVLQWVGIPTCVGVAPTKTLAKFCNHLAKKHAQFKGVVVWPDWTDAIQDRALNSEPVSEIWGIGRKLTESLNRQGIKTAKDLKYANTASLRRQHGVVLERIQRELQGIPCLELDEVQDAKKQLIRSRSFSQEISDLPTLSAAITHHISSGAAALRKQKSQAYIVGVTIRTNQFKDTPQEYGWQTMRLAVPSSDTILLNQAAQTLLKRIYKKACQYKKCGIELSGIESVNHQQQDWLVQGDSDERLALMGTVDRLNQRYGPGTLVLGSENYNKDWLMRRDLKSLCCTTQFSELLHIK